MTAHRPHPHTAPDRFPQLVRGLVAEHGPDGIAAIVEHVIEAEHGDFCWAARIAERDLGPIEQSLDEDGAVPCTRVAILGYFRQRYYVAICLADADRQLIAMLRVRPFEDHAAAETALAAII
jgi:hypothetical protein